MNDSPDSAVTPNHGPGYYVDVGIYGCSPKIPKTHRKVARKIIKLKISRFGRFLFPQVATKMCEKFTLEVGGQQATYAQTYMTREEFREMFPRGLYDRVRERLPLCKDGFPDVYDKISKVAREEK